MTSISPSSKTQDSPPNIQTVYAGTNNSTNTPLLSLNGQLIIGSSTTSPGAATLTAGSGITITNGPGSITIASSGAASNYTVLTANTGLVQNSTYCVNGSSLLTLTLPTTIALGSIIIIENMSSFGFQIAQNTGQQIKFLSNATSTGTTGYLTNTNQYDCLGLRCIVANTTFQVVSSMGNIGFA